MFGKKENCTASSEKVLMKKMLKAGITCYRRVSNEYLSHSVGRNNTWSLQPNWMWNQ